MKILNKENIKWWGKQGKQTWAYKLGEDWWIIKPNQKIESISPRKEKSKNSKEVNWRKAFIASLAGSVLGLGFFCLFLMYLLLKNAF